MNDDRIPVEDVQRGRALGGCIPPKDDPYLFRRSEIERVVLAVYRREQQREWEHFKAGRGRGDALPADPAPAEEPDPFREAVGELVLLVEVLLDKEMALFREERIRVHGFSVGTEIADRVRGKTPLHHALAKVKAMLEASP